MRDGGERVGVSDVCNHLFKPYHLEMESIGAEPVVQSALAEIGVAYAAADVTGTKCLALPQTLVHMILEGRLPFGRLVPRHQGVATVLRDALDAVDLSDAPSSCRIQAPGARWA